MTLTILKDRLKVATLVLAIGVYGTTSFVLGASGVTTKFVEIFQKPQLSVRNRLALPIESPIPSFDTQKGQVIASSVKLCSNTFYGFELSYPSQWFTTNDTQLNKCNYFAPYSFVIPLQTEENFVPVKVEPIRPIDWPQTIKYFENPNEFQNIVSVKTITVNERSILKIDAQTTGVNSTSAGLLKISLLVFNSRAPLVFSYQQINENEDTKSAVETLEEMVESLNYF